jgi:hypothetical protein
VKRRDRLGCNRSSSEGKKREPEGQKEAHRALSEGKSRFSLLCPQRRCLTFASGSASLPHAVTVRTLDRRRIDGEEKGR